MASWNPQDLWLVLKRRGKLTDRLAPLYEGDDNRCLDCTHPLQDVIDIIDYARHFQDIMPQCTKVSYTLDDAIDLMICFVNEYKRKLGYSCTCTKFHGLWQWDRSDRMRDRATAEIAEGNLIGVSIKYIPLVRW